MGKKSRIGGKKVNKAIGRKQMEKRMMQEWRKQRRRGRKRWSGSKECKKGGIKLE